MVEKNFEDDIVNSLVQSGYNVRVSENYDSALGLDSETLFQFLNDSQSDEISKIEHDFGAKSKEKITDTINSEITQRGVIDVIRNGIKINDASLLFSYRKPQSQKNKILSELYQKNIFTVIRQLRFSQTTSESIDLVIFLNGFPIATAELKDQFSKQTAEDAKKQYMNRNTIEKIFSFKNGAIVHFAVDYDNIFMTTKLANADTVFLPFNNPDADDKKSYPTSYLWKDIWSKDNLLNILHNFVHLQVEKSKIDSSKILSESVIFPRFHQWDAVNKIILDTKQKGPGNKYLVEHSTGSGKSFSIAWLSYALHSVRDYDGNSIFDGVIVISDRTIIVDQLRDEIKQFEDTEGLVPNIIDSSQLGDELEHSNKIIVSTQQKFFAVKDRIGKLGGKHYAVIVDEAQSSQGGDASDKVRDALVDLDSFGTRITSGKENISYFAFSGTPKEKTLSVFGTLAADGKTKVPFHKYTMKQAIEEGFILDVLKNYTTIQRLFTVVQKGTDKQVDAKKALREIMQLVNEDPKNISKKSNFIVEHFKNHSMQKIGGNAKSMVVTEKRKQAVLFKITIDDYLEHNKLNF
ncbi:MAG: type I restriction endonuclease subunit R [Candidatus Nitrosopelagicus sp.]|nr:type I restriction endonuclease subunit R [Candidatus Nitrosopelagicus sp.]